MSPAREVGCAVFVRLFGWFVGNMRSFIRRRKRRVGCIYKDVDSSLSRVCTMDHCYSAYSVAEDGTEEYTTPSLLASQQDFTPNFDATRLRLDSPYQPKGVYRQRRKFLGSPEDFSAAFYFGITAVILMRL